MKKKIFFTINFIFVTLFIFSQNDTNIFIKYTPKFEFIDGLYLNFEQVKNNSPLPKTRISTNLSYKRLDFFTKLKENEYIIIFDNKGVEQKIETKKIWGFCQKGNIYINWNSEFNRIGIIGSICHFIADLTVSYERYPDPYYNNRAVFGVNGDTYKTKEMKQYLLDFETGKVFDYNVQNLEILLKKDSLIYEEYIDLRKRKKRKQKFQFLRKYNKKNPLYVINKN